MELRCENITVKYGNKSALQDITLTLTPGLYGLIGKNGAGKTTLFNILVDLLFPTKGEVTYDGTSIHLLNEKYREILGYLPQHFGYNPNLSVFEYLNYIAVLKDIPNSLLKTRIDEVLSTVNLMEQKNTKLHKLSGGMLQRVGIAQSLLNNPKVLILDEPTVGLDPMERIKFRQIFANLSTERIVIISSHIISDISSIAEQVIILHEGKMIGNGNIHNILQTVSTNVWEISIPVQELENYVANSIIVNQSYHDDRVHLRYLRNEPMDDHSTMKEKGLEDAYVWAIEKEKIS